MAKLHRCPECGAVDIRASVRHLLWYLFSARYRKAWRKFQATEEKWMRMILGPSIPPGTTIHIPYIGKLREDDE